MKSIVNEKLKIVNSLKYKDVKVINFINILFCKKGDNEIDLVDIDLDILSKLKTKSLHIAYNNNNGFYYIVNNEKLLVLNNNKFKPLTILKIKPNLTFDNKK